MVLPKPAVIAALLVITVAICGVSAVEGSPSLGHLVRKAIHSGLPWTTYIGDMRKRGVAETLSFDLCIPGKTCKGPVAQLFYSSNCAWAQTYGYIEMGHASSSLDNCRATDDPVSSELLTCPQGAGNSTYYMRSIFDSSDCTGVFRSEERFKAATCIGGPQSPGTVVWCDASQAVPLSSIVASPADLSAPLLPKEDSTCYVGPPAPGDKCDSNYALQASQYLKTEPAQPTCVGLPYGPNTNYVFGTGVVNKCYLSKSAEINMWLAIDHVRNSYTITKNGGCADDGAPWYSLTRFFGCSWASEGLHVAELRTIGPLQG